ncbi:TetR family transcriptional regulator [Arthrobacter sp. TMT4-20]
MHPDEPATEKLPTTEPAARTALGVAASRTLPLVQLRRGTVLRDAKGVARRLTMAAIDLFATDGFEQVTVTDIAAVAGVNRRTFFRYFPSKETIVLDIWDQTNESLVDLIGTTPGDGPFASLGSAVVAWCVEYEELLAGLAGFSEQSRTLSAATMLHSLQWEERIAEALQHRFPDLEPDAAEVAGIIAMGSLRVARKRMLSSGERYPYELEKVIAAVERAR